MTRGGATIEAAFAGTLGTFSLDLEFAAPSRGVTAIFGPSGSGKTTVLRCLAGLQRLKGRLRVGSELWQDDAAGVFLKSHRRAVGYVFQEASLFDHLPVRRNLLYGRRRAGRGDAADAPGLDEIVAFLGIGHLLDRAPVALSGGERQRVAIGRALLSGPRLLLMDEPLASLDRATKDEIVPYLEALHGRLSVPIIYVSHDIGEVARLADHIVVLSAGRKVSEGPVAGTLERLDLQPATGRFEAGVVLTARVAGHDTGFQMTHLDHHGQTIAVPMVDFAIGSEVRIRVRARDVVLAAEEPRAISVRNILRGTVAEIAEEAASAYAETLVDIGGAGIRARLTRAAVADLGLAPGKPVFVLVKSVAFDRRALAVMPPPPTDAAEGDDGATGS